MTTDQQKIRRRSPLNSSKQDNDSTQAIPEITKPAPAVIPVVDQQSTKGSRIFVFSLCLIFRLVNAYFTRTFDNPDEYWQSQEVAHNMVFGYGYLTWEWTSRIRSYAHPIMFAIIYKLLAWLQLDETRLLILAPKLFQASMTAVTDYATYLLGKRVMGNTIAPYLLFITLCSWYNFFIAARTLSNTVETMFTVIALNYWPSTVTNFSDNNWIKNYRISLLWASLACIMRPTNALIWTFTGLQLAVRSSGHRISVLLNAAIIVAIILAANIALDTFIYSKEFNVEKLVLTPINFFKINVLQSISLIYGVHPWHWYISQGVPVILTTMLPFAIYGYGCTPNKAKDARFLGHLIIWVLGVYSLLSHKEFRFIFPVVPLILIFVANGLSNIPTRWRKLSAIALMITQVPMALYLSLWHQRGVTDVMLWIRDQANNSSVHSVGVLMPCHSTPWQSVVHRSDVDMWFLTCEPPLHSNEEDYIDEADRFYANPVLFLEKEVGQPERPWPTHLVLFENLLKIDDVKIKETFTKNGYRECARFFNSHFHDDWRRRGDVLVYCR